MTRSRLAAAAALGLAISAVAPGAHAGGLYATDRGVRPLARGGAFVAGADDLGAIWYNPAGLADAGTGILADFSWLNFSTDYKRQTQVTDAAGTVRVYESPTVTGTTPVIPIPTLAGSYAFGEKKELTAAFGLVAPNTAISSYPLTQDGQPAPSRYSLVSMNGSALVLAGAYLSYKPIEQIRLGMGLQATVGKFASTVVFSASPADRLISSPEDPQYDTLSQLNVGPIFAPSANFGAIAVPTESVRIGLSAQLPTWINSPATVNVRLPTAVPFDKARQEGEDANVRFRLPPILRGGVEYRARMPKDALLRVEVAYVREFWSLHDSIDIRSKNIKLYDITGFPSPFGVAPISLPRGFTDSNSFRLGGEYSMRGLISDYLTDLRAGVAYDTTAIPVEYVSPLTVDGSKITASVGGGLHIGEHWRFDAMFTFVAMANIAVDPGEAKVPRVNPVKGNPTQTEAINGGVYQPSATVLGIGAQYKF
ncbi:MAG: outer membrane protein transport protein [Polyangiaceae bacterium]